ncbi:thaumatin-like protein 1 [Tanacetum coccineum]
MAYHVKNCLISLIVLTIFCFTSTQAANFDVINQCQYTVWVAASPGGGRRLETGQSWQLTAKLALKPKTTIIHSLTYISLVDGFNIPMEFSPGDASCKKLSCGVDLNSQCPEQLRTQGGCNNPCTVFKTVEYCCTIERGSCGPTDYSRFFKDRCPDAYSYPQDDPTSQSSCPGGTNYKVVFCP